MTNMFSLFVFHRMPNTPVILYIFHHVQQEALLVKQTAIHGGHMCKESSASTTSPSFSKTVTSAFSFYSPQHMSLLW